MKKYWPIFKISFQQEFIYKVNFVMWRMRNVFQILITYFLWEAAFGNTNQVFFGYDKSKILTYVFTLMIVRSIVLSARAVDVSTDITDGNLSNYLLKPMSYFKYWLTRDFSSKLLNLGFATLEFTILFIILKPPFFLQTNIYVLFSFVISILVAVAIYFSILFIVSAVPFWAPEFGWASQFLIIVVIVEFLSGALFPIDILPQYLQKIVLASPFPYMIYFPVQVYLGKITGPALVGGFLISLGWACGLWFVMRYIWSRGLKVYQAVGR